MKIYIWDENKRQINLAKHGLDFADADEVLSSPYRFDVETIRNNEVRTQSFAYSFGRLLVLSLAHTERENCIRLISFRPASKAEREAYYEYLQQNLDE
ncbi:BrnT family toxin [Mannheimia pernigra]|uniref:BrnT family toxin n=1 Tax=Mannheimia pernigra TaxID=111844 RepID=UPI0013169C4E|nr:BrnT family toxin [Mannheimia pernigra]MDO4429913.1 BrnT family toxin [Lonepinella koalarum]QHB18096.1 BrnT family toxin [Mannheimia pernigra]